jgi:hypothetical protein
MKNDKPIHTINAMSLGLWARSPSFYPPHKGRGSCQPPHLHPHCVPPPLPACAPASSIERRSAWSATTAHCQSRIEVPYVACCSRYSRVRRTPSPAGINAETKLAQVQPRAGPVIAAGCPQLAGAVVQGDAADITTLSFNKLAWENLKVREPSMTKISNRRPQPQHGTRLK